MATREADLDLGGAAPKKGGVKSWLMIGGGVAALIAASIGGTVYLLGGKAEPADGKQAKAEKVVAPPVYTPLEPPFVVNFEDEGTIRFLQVSVEVMSRDPKVAEAIKLHMPAIRDQLIMLFSDVDYAALSSREGKDALRGKAFDAVKSILKAQGASSRVEGVYFTNFVMQ
ncbi:MAG: flagellar basal body-associated FliL family protein [Pseudomonadota bacterium]